MSSKEKVAVVSGGSKGLGLSICATLLAQAGAGAKIQHTGQL